MNNILDKVKYLALGLMVLGTTSIAHAQTAEKEAPKRVNWIVQCSNNNAQAELRCTMSQNIVQNNGALVAAATISKPSDLEPMVLGVQLPFGLDLSQPAQLVVDGKEIIDFPISTCEQRGCFASVKLTEGMLSPLKNGNDMVIRIKNNGGKTINLQMTLDGFSKAFKLLQ